MPATTDPTRAAATAARALTAPRSSDAESIRQAEDIAGQPWVDDRDGKGSELGERAGGEVWAWAQQRQMSVNWMVFIGDEVAGHGGAPTLEAAKGAASRVIIGAASGSAQ